MNRYWVVRVSIAVALVTLGQLATPVRRGAGLGTDTENYHQSGFGRSGACSDHSLGIALNEEAEALTRLAPHARLCRHATTRGARHEGPLRATGAAIA